MAIRNDTLRKKLEEKRTFILDKMAPLKDELDMVQGMLDQMEGHNARAIKSAEDQLGLDQNASKED